MSRLLLALLALVLAFVPASRAEERILSFDSRIEVEKNGELRVTETIEVWVEGDRIKRGIYRDLPTDRKGKDGLRSAKRFKVVSVKRDGKREDYQREWIENGIRIRIGNAEKKLRTGRAYTYEILYLTDRQLYLEEERDALYWNVNGTEWGFPADKVTATVHLPSGIKGTKVGGSTGKLGQQGKDYRAELTETGAKIVAARRFQPKENLTVVLEWPPGLLDARAYEESRVSLFRDLPLVAFGLVLLVGSLAYHLVVWLKVGKDPEEGTIIPLYGPPEGLSAAAVRYIASMGYDKKCFSAGVVGLAAKGQATIEKDGKIYVLHPRKLTAEQEGQLLKLLNEGEAEELEEVDGISKRRAQDIQKARPYAEVKDVLRVKGIGKGAVARMENHVVSSDVSSGAPGSP